MEPTTIILAIVLCGLGGALLGLIPFLVGRNGGQPDLGRNGLLCCVGAGLSVILSWAVPAIVAVFVIGIIGKGSSGGSRSGGQPYPVPTPPGPAHNMGIKCVSGPLMGQVFPVGPYGLIVGRDNDCAIKFDSNQPGVSRHHCSIRWEGGELMLTDHSTHGTFLFNGTRLTSQVPTQIPANTRFYLVNSEIMFQVVIM